MDRQKIKAVQDLIRTSKSRRRKKRTTQSRERQSEPFPNPIKSCDKDLSSFLPGIGDFSRSISRSKLSREKSNITSGANKYLVPLNVKGKGPDKAKSQSQEKAKGQSQEKRRSRHSRRRTSGERIEETRIQYKEYSRVEKHRSCSSNGTEEYSSQKVTIRSARSKQIFFTQGREDDYADDEYSSDTYSDFSEVDYDEDEEEDIEEIKEEVQGEVKRKAFWRYPKTGKRGLDRFRRAVDFVLISRQLFQCKQSTLTHEESVLFFVDIAVETKQTSSKSNGKTKFDLSPYTNLKEQNLLNKLQSVLNQPSYCRTDEQIATTMHMLQSYTSFASYPNHVQTKICQKAWISKFESSRVICREGQRAECMYMILVGVAVSRTSEIIHSKHSNGTEATRVLKKGDIIGESEILEGKVRGSTIISKEAVQVIGLDKEDVIDILVTATNKESLAFLRKIPELSLFPLQELTDRRYSCTRIYKNGSIIVYDSDDTDSVYVVKSGSCQLYKAIKCQSDILPIVIKEDAKSNKDLTLPPIVMRRKSDASTRQFSRRNSRIDSSFHLPSINSGDERNLSQRRNSRQFESQLPGKLRKRASICSRRSSNASTLSSTDGFPGTNELGAFAKLGTLCAGNTFGLQPLVYPDTPSFSLVSSGCVCIQISREFFEKHMDSVLVAKLKTKLSPYPTLAQLQSTLEDQVYWEDYKEQMYNRGAHEE